MYRKTLSLILATITALGILVSCTVADYPAPALGVVVDNQFTVLDVLNESAAEEAGVQIGDVLVALNGSTYATHGQWVTEVSKIEVGQTYTLTVQRGGNVITLRVISTYPPRIPPGVTPTVIPTEQFYIR